MAFAISTSGSVPKWKTDYSPADRQENYNAIMAVLGQYVPLEATGEITYNAATKVATVTASAPGEAATLTYQWAASATEDGTYTNIADATSATFTATSTQSEKFLGCKVTNTVNGGAATALIKYGQLPAIGA